METIGTIRLVIELHGEKCSKINLGTRILVLNFS